MSICSCTGRLVTVTIADKMDVTVIAIVTSPSVPLIPGSGIIIEQDRLIR